MENSLFNTINEHSHMPYYVQIKCYLRQIIKEIGPNALVPSEKELADKFGVSRGTAKQAIMDLVYEGVLYRKQGKGTFTASHIARTYDRLPTFTPVSYTHLDVYKRQSSTSRSTQVSLIYASPSAYV